MKKSLLSAVALSAFSLAVPASAETLGVTISKFDDNFLTLLRNGIIEHTTSLDGVTVQIEDAQGDTARQLNQIQNFVASGVDAIIVNAVDTDATSAMTAAAANAGIPLVYVNYEPVNVDSLPESQAFVASDEKESGTLQTREVCRQLSAAGVTDAKVVVIMGELQHQAARLRTQDIRDVIATPECSFMKVVEEQSANWQRTQAVDLMTNWLSAGVEFDAVIANNDEMALGAIQALKSAGHSMDSVIVAGIDATRDALAAMAAGDLDVTIFQDAEGQGRGAVDAALSLARGEHVDQKVYIPFELVTAENLADYQNRN